MRLLPVRRRTASVATATLAAIRTPCAAIRTGLRSLRRMSAEDAHCRRGYSIFTVGGPSGSRSLIVCRCGAGGGGRPGPANWQDRSARVRPPLGSNSAGGPAAGSRVRARRGSSRRPPAAGPARRGAGHPPAARPPCRAGPTAAARVPGAARAARRAPTRRGPAPVVGRSTRLRPPGENRRPVRGPGLACGRGGLHPPGLVVSPHS